MIQRRPCKGCGKEIIVMQDDVGKFHYLDATAPVYGIQRTLVDGRLAVSRLKDAHVYHAAVCKNPPKVKGRP